MQKFNKQQGFTLIELVMVIVILGVLSAFALPRFADLGTDARKASLSGLSASVRAASNIAHAQYLVSGVDSNGKIKLDNVNIDMENGYPTTASTGITAAAQVSGSDYTIDVSSDKATVTYQVSGAKTAATCQVVYTAATSGASASVTKADGGC